MAHFYPSQGQPRRTRRCRRLPHVIISLFLNTQVGTMKRARETSSKLVEEGKNPASARAPAPARAPAVTAGSPKRREMSSKSTSTSSAVVPLPPPPPIQPFSDDSGEEDGTSPGVSSSSSSSSSSGGSAEGGGTKRARKEQIEVQGWRKRALAILEGDEPARDGEIGTSRKKFAVVCSSNVNRSIMAEILLQKHDMRVRSFGTGRYGSFVTKGVGFFSWKF